jgi:isopenicillin N synthase-like dioxygenase
LADKTEKSGNIYSNFDARFRSQEDRFGLSREALSALPVIDIAPLVQESSSLAERQAVGRKIRAASVDLGFFYAVGHGITQSELDELNGWVHRFFELPFNEKMKLDNSKRPWKLGYLQAGGTNADATADTRESFHMSRELELGEQGSPSLGAGLSVWPDPDVLPGFSAFIKNHIAKRVTVARKLVRGLALSLELPETYFDEMFRYPGGFLSFNYYPPKSPEAGQRKQWGISPHSDYSGFTMLSQDEHGGLEVRNSAGEWVNVTPLEGAFVVNIADLLAIWTNDLFTPALHRASNVRSDVARVSVPLFFGPSDDTVVSCLETCQSPDNPPRYTPRTAGAHVLALLEASHDAGRIITGDETARRLNEA